MSSNLKNVVIIGGAGGGAQVARDLEKSLPDTHRLILIEKNEFAYWPIGGLRAAVKPGFEKDCVASFDGFFGKDSRHIVLAGYTVTELSENQVKLEKAAPTPLDSDTIPVEVGIIASGSTYAIPMRPMSTKLDEALDGLRKMQKDIESAKHILIVGGGPVGVEFAGEVLFQHPTKKVTLVNQGDHLIQGFRPALGKTLLTQMQKKENVNVRLGTSLELTDSHFDQAQKLLAEPMKVKLSDGTEEEIDFLFIATGGKPNTSLVSEEVLDDGKPKRIDVNASTLRVVHSSLAKKWFAMGDASNAPGSKTYMSVTSQGPVVAAQVKSLIANGSASTKGFKPPPNVLVVPFGENAGAAQLFYPVFGEWVTTMIKSKTLFVDKFRQMYPGTLPA